MMIKCATFGYPSCKANRVTHAELPHHIDMSGFPGMDQVAIKDTDDTALLGAIPASFPSLHRLARIVLQRAGAPDLDLGLLIFFGQAEICLYSELRRHDSIQALIAVSEQFIAHVAEKMAPDLSEAETAFQALINSQVANQAA